MRLSDLQSKDIVSMKDGKRLGKLVDAEIDQSGLIIYMVVEERKIFKNFAFSGSETTIEFKKIIKIGEDVILVEI